TLMTGNAAIQAAQRAREFLDAAVAEKLEIPLERVTAADGRLFDAQDPEKGLDLAQAVELAETKFGAIGTTGSYKPPRSPGRYKGAGVGPSPTYSYSACVIEVEADQETGIVVPIKVWIAHDLGRAVNPLLAIGQVEGSIYMGLGEALMEEQVFRKGVHKIPSMLDYKSPTSMDMCPIETFLIEDPDAEGPYGAKECGQGPLLPVPPAVVNAVYDALGVRIDEIPVTPERVLKALQAGQKGLAARFGPKGFPKVAYPEPLWVPPPWEGGDGRAQERPSPEREAALQTHGGHE
ncbi:MAG: molybdopterin cofactor-binding domain-containing protein, partial [Acidobacteriota bacterium]